MRYVISLLLLFAASVSDVALAQSQAEKQPVASKPQPPPEILTSPGAWREAVGEIVKLTNDFREREVQSTVSEQAELTAAAEYFADYMATKHKYGHKVDGNTPSQRAAQYGYEFCIVAENIAYLYSSVPLSPQEVAKRFVDGWENSPEHRRNMLDPDVVHLGVAVAQSSQTGYYFAVQEFGRPKSLRIDFELANRSSAMIKYASGERDFELPPGFSRTHSVCRPGEIKLYAAGEISSDKPQVVGTIVPVAQRRYLISGKLGQLKLQQEELACN